MILICNSLPAAEPAWQTGPKYRTAINEPFAAAWKNVELREVLAQIQEQTGVAILLDRRIDPNQSLEVNFTGKPLREGLADLAAQIGAGISTPENVIYIGPPAACRKLRTLVALRSQSAAPKAGFQRPPPRITIRWNDLDAPAVILKSIAEKQRMQIANLDGIEHDLWAGATLPSVTPVESISLILIQFELTFRAESAGPRSTITLVSVPDDVRIEEEHTLPQKAPDQRLAEWRTRFPDLTFDRQGSKVKVAATVEEHEALRAAPTKSGPKPAGTLAKEVFSLKIKDVAVRDLMAELEKSGVQFEYDPAALKDAGVDLDRFIELDVEKLPAHKFFHAIFGPLGVRSEIDGMKVKLTPQ